MFFMVGVALATDAKDDAKNDAKDARDDAQKLKVIAGS